MNTELNLVYKWVYITLIILAIFLGIKVLASIKELGNTDPAYNSITVSGEGEVFMVPDIASFSYTVSADANEVSAAQKEVTEKSDAIIAKLKEMGVEEKDIKTTDYSVYPKYRYDVAPAIYPPIPGRQTQDGFTVSHSVTVKVRDTAKAGEGLSAAGVLGATNMSGISFTIDDQEKLTNQARALAIEDAKNKAELLTDELGVRIKRVVSYSDSTDGGPMPYYREGYGMGGDAVVSQAKAPSLPTGENKVVVSVSVTYEIR